MKKLISITGLLTLIFITTACGNLADQEVRMKQAAFTTPISTSGDSNAATQQIGDYDCPVESNVKPAYDWNFNGSDYYTACASRSSTYKILLRGRPNNGTDSFCVFPIEYVDQTRFFYKIDIKGLPMFYCTNTTEAGIVLNFNLTNYNAVLVVDPRDRAAMGNCLIDRGLNCPAYSHGRFR